jgi:hypothetical protein
MFINQIKWLGNNRLASYAKHGRYLNQQVLLSSFFDYQVVTLNIIINLI